MPSYRSDVKIAARERLVAFSPEMVAETRAIGSVGERKGRLHPKELLLTYLCSCPKAIAVFFMIERDFGTS